MVIKKMKKAEKDQTRVQELLTECEEVCEQAANEIEDAEVTIATEDPNSVP